MGRYRELRDARARAGTLATPGITLVQDPALLVTAHGPVGVARVGRHLYAGARLVFENSLTCRLVTIVVYRFAGLRIFARLWGRA